MSLEVETPNAISDLLEVIRESPIPVFYSIVIFILMLIDYGVGAVPGLGDIIDLVNLLTAMVVQGDEGDEGNQAIDLTNGILAFEFIPFIGDFLPTELFVFVKLMYKRSPTLTIILVIVGIVLVVALFLALVSVVGLAGLWYGGYLLI